MRKPEEAKILSNEEYLDLKKRIEAGDEQAFNILKDKTTTIMCQHFLVDDFVSRYKHLSKDDMAYYICELINHNFNNVVKTKGLLPTASKHLIRCKQNCYYLFQRKNDDRELAIQDAPHIEFVSFEALQANELDSINADDEVEARMILTPAMMRRMTALRKSFDRDLMLSFNGNMLYYASETPDGFLRPGRKSLDDEHLLEQLYREVNFCLRIDSEINNNNIINK